MAAPNGNRPRKTGAGRTGCSRTGTEKKRRGGAGEPSRKVAKDMVVLELRRLRAMFTEIAERYVANAEGEIAAVIETVEGKSIPATRVEKMLEVVHTLSVKPRKGRRKDLARIDGAIASLRKELGE